MWLHIARAGEEIFHIDAAHIIMRLDPRPDLQAWARGGGSRASFDVVCLAGAKMSN